MMAQINLMIVGVGILAICLYIALMYLPFFKHNTRHSGRLTLGMAVMMIVLAIILYAMKGWQA